MLRPPYAWMNRFVGMRERRPARRHRAGSPRLLAGMDLLEDRTLLAKITVHIFNFDFSANPEGQPIVDPTIHIGDTIHWVLDAGSHTTTSVLGSAEAWNSGTMMVGATFDHTFTHSGVFAYYCGFHGT